LVQFPLDPRDLDTDVHRGLWTNVFRFTNRDDVTAAATARYLRDERQKARAIVVETQTVYGSSMSVQFVTAWKAPRGTIIDHHQVSEGCEHFVARERDDFLAESAVIPARARRSDLMPSCFGERIFRRCRPCILWRHI